MSAKTSSLSTSTPPRKGMRKGTHSCFECRRRKIRCIFCPEDPHVCVSCNSRGSRCIEQRRELVPSAAEKSKSNLKERVAKLEAIIEASSLSAQHVTLNQAAGGGSGDSHDPISNIEEATPLATDSSVDKATPVSSSLTSGSVSVDADSQHDTDPIATLFNNAFWRRMSPDGTSDDAKRNSITGLPVSNAGPRAFAKRRITREALLSVLPAPELLGEVLNITCSWWNSWKPLGPWLSDSTSNENPKTLQEFVLWALSSENPSIVGLAILSIAVSIQQLDIKTHDYIICRLRRLPGELFHDYFELVDRLIVNDSEFASSREGIEVIVMAAKLLMNFGLLKKCWILNHRAGSYAQLLGLHRPQRLFRNESDIERTRRHRSWLSICQADVLISLLLGLPYYSDGRTVPISIFGDSGTTSFFQLKLIGLSARVIDKNQTLSLSVQTTQDIQKDLDYLAEQMHQDFWDVQGTLSQGKITRDEYFERITAQFWYHLIRLYLHMPLLIQSIEDSRLGAHREICLKACRDTLHLYTIMRCDSGSAFNMVKVIDYEAFICSSLLLLGMMGYGSPQSPFQVINSDRDRDLVLLTLSILRQASTSSDNTIASEAVQGLETLTSLASGSSCPRRGQKCQNPYARIVVPYSGTITISPGSFFTNQQASLGQSAANEAPIFTLSHGDFQSVSNHNQSQSRVPIDELHGDFEGFGPNSTGEGANPMGHEYPSIDFDWGSMINMNTDEDWAWLMDVNSNNIN